MIFLKIAQAKGGADFWISFFSMTSSTLDHSTTTPALNLELIGLSPLMKITDCCRNELELTDLGFIGLK